MATKISAYALLTLGTPAIAEGNVILINDVKLGIVEACSGLGMMMTFFALSTAFALLMRSSELWLRIIVAVSAIPVAIFANVVRITVTGLLYYWGHDQLAHWVFHDVAGWLMMPLAVAMLFVEIHVIRRLVVERPARELERGLRASLSAKALERSAR
jgi:exosortase